jgi:hypothetical protein
MPLFINPEDYDCPVYHKMAKMWYGAKQRSKQFGREFSLTLDDVVNRYVEICPILGIEIMWDNRDKVCQGSPSLDRVNNQLGYIPSNIQIISYRANFLKKDYLLCEWEKMQRYMQECDGKPLEITELHFKEHSDVPPEAARRIRQGIRKGQSVTDIAIDLDLNLGMVVRYAHSLK